MAQTSGGQLLKSIKINGSRSPLLLDHRCDARLTQHVSHHLNRHRTALNACSYCINALQIIRVLQKFAQSSQHPQRLDALLEVEQHRERPINVQCLAMNQPWQSPPNAVKQSSKELLVDATCSDRAQLGTWNWVPRSLREQGRSRLHHSLVRALQRG